MKNPLTIGINGPLCVLLSLLAFSSQAAEDVLTLDEAAQLLRAKPEDVAQMARRNELPGRRIGSEWRFHRTAVMAWLAGKDPVAAALLSEHAEDRSLTPPQETRDKPKVRLLASADLEHIKGRGVASSTNAPATDKKPETMGQKPEETTAEQVFLRDQGVLLKPRQMTLELGFLYQRLDQHIDLPVLNANRGGLSSWNTDREVDSYTSAFTVRYGLLKDLQVFAAIPLQHTSTTWRQSDIETSRILENFDISGTKWGNVTTGIRWGALREGLGHPSVILSVTGSFPTDDWPYSVGGSIALTKSYDPAILFANLEYLHNFVDDEKDVVGFGFAEDRFITTFGIAYALNETLTLSTRFIGDFGTRTVVDGRFGLPSTQRYSLQLGMTSLLTDNLYIEPTVRFGLNGDTRNLALGINLPYTFDL
ncbi:helix-turn-helix domain-containing protein [Methylocaldum szegediense]|uniref:Helix-turn-helix domain-containing protein n=1 Tax=Methylocaldum szegediense TaxID=73780 RepID=A0ABN8XAP1_9GAMM|nr:helix-turn-helix domain-containing protein [Methylocaldum szegediense]CAI8929579.1 putative Helix-turn-helix domain-containing protein [Methylocaldum szegediense]